MGNFMETSQGAPVKWALSLSMYVKSPGRRLNTVFVISFRYLLLQKLCNDLVYVIQVIIWEYAGWLALNWGVVMVVFIKSLQKWCFRSRCSESAALLLISLHVADFFLKLHRGQITHENTWEAGSISPMKWLHQPSLHAQPQPLTPNTAIATATLTLQVQIFLLLSWHPAC